MQEHTDPRLVQYHQALHVARKVRRQLEPRFAGSVTSCLADLTQPEAAES